MTASMRAAAPPQQLTLHCRGRRLAAQAWGDPASPRTVLALHGWLDNANSFVPLAPYLTDTYLVAVDLPGHGLSQHRSADAQYHFIDWVGDVLDVADTLNLPRFALMGHSMGAGVATLVAGAYPERVSALLLLDGLGPLSREAESAPQRLSAHRLQMARLVARQSPVYPNVATLAAVLCKVVPQLSLKSAHVLLQRGAEQVFEGATCVGVRSVSDPRLRATSLFQLTEAQVQAFLQAIACPTVLLRPHDGYPFAPDLFDRRLACIAHAHCVRLSGGHHVHMEQPDEVAALLRPFLV
jgi:pimeloyl-ACP methyl ester carboxylesterase